MDNHVDDIMQRVATIDPDALQDPEALILSSFDALTLQRDQAVKEREQLRTQKDAAYTERNRCVVALVKLALALGYRGGVGQHDPTDTEWEDDWRTIVFLELPEGQVSWHFHNSERLLLVGLPLYDKAWDGHTTEEKYFRLAAIDETENPTAGMVAELVAAKTVESMQARSAEENREIVEHLNNMRQMIRRMWATPRHSAYAALAEVEEVLAVFAEGDGGPVTAQEALEKVRAVLGKKSHPEPNGVCVWCDASHETHNPECPAAEAERMSLALKWVADAPENMPAEELVAYARRAMKLTKTYGAVKS